MEDNKPLGIGLVVVVLLLLGVMYWKYMVPHVPPPGRGAEPYVPPPASYGAGATIPPGGPGR